MASRHSPEPLEASEKLEPFSSAAIAMQAVEPSHMARSVSIAICVMALLALVYAYFTHIDVVVSAQGRVIPTGKSKVIQPLETGLVKTIAVRDGQRVKAGDILVTLDPTNSGADSERLRQELAVAGADSERLGTLLNGRSTGTPKTHLDAEVLANQQSMLTHRQSEQRAKLAALDAEMARRKADAEALEASMAQLSSSLPLVRKKHAMRVDLAKTGHIADAALIETELEVINLERELNVQKKRLAENAASQSAIMQQRAQAVAEFNSRVSSELAEANKRRDAYAQELIKAEQRREQSILRSPIDGTVQQLVLATVGGVVTPAQVIMTIVPDNASLEVEAQILNKDVGHVRAGQRVINKIETYDFTRFGYIEGEVVWVGSDAVVDQKLGLVFPVRIKLNANETPNRVNGRLGQVFAGMNVTSDIKTGERRMLEYFLAPMLRYKEESLRER